MELWAIVLLVWIVGIPAAVLALTLLPFPARRPLLYPELSSAQVADALAYEAPRAAASGRRFGR